MWNNLVTIQKQFSEQGKSFFIYPEHGNLKTLNDIYSYCYPNLHLSNIEDLGVNIPLGTFNNTNVEEGFLVVHQFGIDVVEYNEKLFFKIKKLYDSLRPTFWDILFNRKKKIDSISKSKDSYLEHLYKKHFLSSRIDFILGRNGQIETPNLVEQIKFFLEQIRLQEQKKSNEPTPYIFYSLKESTDEEILAEWLKEIENKLNRINSTELLYDTVSKLNEIITNNYNHNLKGTKDDIKITDDYKIRLPLFSEMEIPMSDLTKVVYILFFNHIQGINIRKLSDHKEELLNIYKKISSLTDYDKMVQKIDMLCNANSKEIYVHISRIKKAFESKIEPHLASQFIVQGIAHGSPVKYIKALQK